MTKCKYQVGCVVQALALSSDGQLSTWVQTPLLVSRCDASHLFPFSPAGVIVMAGRNPMDSTGLEIQWGPLMLF